MSENLRDLLHELADHETASADAAAPDPATELRGLLTDIRARRTRRHAVVGAAAVTVLAVGVATATALTPAPTPPAIPAPSPTAPATAGPAPTAASTAAAPPVTTAPHLPAAVPLEPGVLEGSTRDWRLVRVAPQDPAAGPAVHYVMDPSGQLHELPVAPALQAKVVVDWLPGTSLAVVAEDVADPARGESWQMPGAPWQVVDLRSGEVVDELPMTVPEEARFWVGFVRDGTSDVLVGVEDDDAFAVERRAADGTVLARARTARAPSMPVGNVLVSPGRDRVLLGLVEPQVVWSTSTLRPGPVLALPHPDRPEDCRAIGWLADDRVGVHCTGGGTGVESWADVSGAELWSVPVDGSDPERVLVGHGEPALHPTGSELVLDLAPGAPAHDLVRVEDAGDPVHLRPDDGLVLWVHGTVGDRLLVLLGGPAGTSDLVALDPRTGDQQLLWADPRAGGTAIFEIVGQQG